MPYNRPIPKKLNLMQSVLKVEQLELQVHLGWAEIEREASQRVLLSIEFYFSELPKAALTDELNDTICYAKIEGVLLSEINLQSFKLLEHLGYRCYELVKNAIPKGQDFKLSVTKFLTETQGSRTFELRV